MDPSPSRRNPKPRELRRRVVLPARMRAGCGWSDACILNVSSRGLMIHASRAALQGSTVELWHGEHVIVARVVWRKGTRAGLYSEERVPVEDIFMMSQAPAIPRTSSDGRPVERRKKPRTHEESRFRGRAMEFASIAVIGISLAAGLFAVVEQAFAEPLAYVEETMGG